MLRYIEYYFGKIATPFPATIFPTIQDLCKEVLQRFSMTRLRNSIQGKLSTAGQPRPVEAQYQDEFYRAFSSIMPHGVAMSSEWSRNANGRIDFFIPFQGWGIELLRGHSRVREHYERFQPGGRYYPWVESGLLKDWIIIDCADTMPAESTVKHPPARRLANKTIGHPDQRLWHAVFQDEYSQLSLLDHENKPLAGPVALAS